MTCQSSMLDPQTIRYRADGQVEQRNNRAGGVIFNMNREGPSNFFLFFFLTEVKLKVLHAPK